MDPRDNIQLQQFVAIFLEKNKVINLSSIREEEEVWTKHIEDSLVITNLFNNYLLENRKQKTENTVEVLDLGTGGGFPGIPLAIMFPECHFTLLDARRKKIDCIAEFVQKLELKNVTPQWGRVEEVQSTKCKVQNSCALPPGQGGMKGGLASTINNKQLTINLFDIIVTRATAYITDLLAWVKPLLKPDGRALLYKMASEEEWNDGVQTAKKLGLTFEKVLEYTLAGQERWIIEIRRK